MNTSIISGADDSKDGFPTNDLQIVCQKCQFYENLKQTLNKELVNKESMIKRIKELEEELEASSQKSSFPKDDIVNGIKAELGKIHETLNFASAKAGSINQEMALKCKLVKSKKPSYHSKQDQKENHDATAN